MPKYKIITTILALLLIPQVCLAQVNVEPLLAKLGDSGFMLHLSGYLNGKEGNTQTLNLGTGLLVGARIDPHLVYLNCSIEYETSQGKVDAQEIFVHLRYNYKFTSWFSWELFGQSEHDRFRQIQRRYLLGTGPRIGIKGDHLHLHYGTSYMPEWTLVEGENTSVLRHRWNNYVSLNLMFDHITVSATIYIQPRFDEFNDYHLLALPSLSFKITKKLSITIGAEIRHASNPLPENVKRWDYAIKNSFIVSF